MEKQQAGSLVMVRLFDLRRELLCVQDDIEESQPSQM